MDIIDFVERVMNVKLKEWQKEYLRALEKLPRGAKIVMAPGGRVYIYPTQQILKELTLNGQTNDHKHQMSSMR